MSDQKVIQPDAETEELFKKALQKNKQEREAEEIEEGTLGTVVSRVFNNSLLEVD